MLLITLGGRCLVLSSLLGFLSLNIFLSLHSHAFLDCVQRGQRRDTLGLVGIADCMNICRNRISACVLLIATVCGHPFWVEKHKQNMYMYWIFHFALLDYWEKVGWERTFFDCFFPASLCVIICISFFIFLVLSPSFSLSPSPPVLFCPTRFI